MFDTSGSHTACGTVEDDVGNSSAPGCVTVQVDATPPSLELTCPTMVAIGSSAQATFEASDAYSGLATASSGNLSINTTKSGVKTTTYTAISNVGLEVSKSCNTYVGYYVVVSGPVHKLVVRDGEADLLKASAKVSGNVTVQPGGALDVEGTTISGGLKAKGAALLRVCSAKVGTGVSVKESSGSVTIGEADQECSRNTVTKAVTITDNRAGVTVEGNALSNSLTIRGNSGGVTVTENEVARNLTITGNTGSVIDRPNDVAGKTKVQ
jgi:hypothetical protein